jgi:hypothetical protein
MGITIQVPCVVFILIISLAFQYKASRLVADLCVKLIIEIFSLVVSFTWLLSCAHPQSEHETHFVVIGSDYPPFNIHSIISTIN